MRFCAAAPVLALALAVGCRHSAPATQAPAPSFAVHAPYIHGDQIDFKALLGDPPADGSPAHRDEIEKMLELQAGRTPEEVKRCQAEEEVSVFAFAPALGQWFTPQNVPHTADLMQEVYDEAREASNGAKKVWKRTRPPKYDDRIKPCVKLENSFSYPSGHATRGMAWAMLLAEIFPERRDAILARGREIGTDRTLAGMHYPSDVKAGQRLGAEVARRLLDDPKFLADFEQVKIECRKAAKKTEM
jgi:hypothetical protein